MTQQRRSVAGPDGRIKEHGRPGLILLIGASWVVVALIAAGVVLLAHG